jgi:glycosyltransferase involved in cell wall biosynthesis
MPVPLKIAYLTSGAAGMFCGSCMHDNTLARALTKLGCDVQLVPLYTPIRTDEESAAVDQVFLGGINVYLQQKLPLFRYLPRWLSRWLDRPSLIRWATSRGIQTKAQDLGALTVSVLKGDEGFQRQEVQRLVEWLGQDQPDVIVFSNMLTAGCVPAIKRRLDAKVVVTLQGDDIFLRDLPEPFQSQAFAEISRLIPHVDGFIANSQYYADFMSGYLGIPRDRIAVVPLGLDTSDFVELLGNDRMNRLDESNTIGYLARLAPEKGLHVLVDAFVYLAQNLGRRDIRLRIAGWLGEHNRRYVDQQLEKIRQAELTSNVDLVGEVDRRGKLDFLKSIDLLCVPTTYREPKGLFVLEALAAGVPVVEPDHGAFPELLARTGGGVLVPPENPVALAEQLANLLADQGQRTTLGRTGQIAVHRDFTAQRMAENTLAALQTFALSALPTKKGRLASP